MPDLSNTFIGANHRRALADFSRFGTRKLVLYTITVYGLPDSATDQIFDFEERYKGEGDSYPSEWIENPGNIIEAIQRGVQLVAEPYAYGDWDYNREGTNYNDIAITAIVASDTFEDAAEQGNIVPPNPNSYTLENAILDAIANFPNDGVEVHRAHLVGYGIQESSLATPRTREGTEESRARWTAQLAKGKNAVKRQG